MAEGAFPFAFYDGRVEFYGPSDLPPEELAKLITPNGGETVRLPRR